MMHFNVLRAATAISAICLLTACGSSAPETVELGGQHATAAPKTVERPWGTVATFPELTKAQTPIAEDVSFATDMISHHEQAIELSENLLMHQDADDRVTAAANFIRQDQSNEITTMSAWLKAWNESGPEHHSHHASTSTMPGMLPQPDVDAVASMSTTQAQVEFLRLMTTHHEGAITMSQDYLDGGSNTFTRSTAQHIIREQQLEIEYFDLTIDDLCEKESAPGCPSK